MADIKISEYSAAAALTGTELVEVVQAGSNKKATASQLRTFAGSGRHMVPIMAVSISPRQSGGCAAIAYLSGAAGQPDIPYLAFDATTAEYAEVLVSMPPSWDEGNILFVPKWGHPAAATNFGVCWKLRGVALSNDDPVAASFGTAGSSTDTGGTANDHYAGPMSAAITIAGALAANDTVCLQIFRDPTDGGDTLAVDAYLFGFDIYYTTNEATD